VDGFLRALRDHSNVTLVGVAEPEAVLRKKYADRYKLDPGIFFADTASMVDQTHPEVVASFTSTYDHPAVVEACAARKVAVMMEKPLAVSMEHARAIQSAAQRGGIPIIVNYETTWYASHAALWQLMKEEKAGGDIRKMVAMDGHQGPKEINVGPEFLGWLTDPVKNGAGALFDFGCYGANLMTWLMDNQPPIAVTAVTQQYKPQTYPRVDDEANILVEYPHAVGIIEGSWNWPYGRKDLEVYAERAAAVATGGNSLRVRLEGKPEVTRALQPLGVDDRDSISYLISVVRGKRPVSGLSSLENNMIVTEILTAARESARTGRKVTLAGR
jgi:predicted dehydrogenase